MSDDITSTITAAVETYWIEGMHDPDMAEWWGTQEAHDSAAALAEAVSGSFTEVGWWHDDPDQCNHFAFERRCRNGGGEWRRVFVIG